MKNIMFLGDSLTAGNLGASYLKLLEAEESLKGFKLINKGEDGFTMAGLQLKLETYLEKEESPEILVIEGGANDLLLPHMQKAGTSWNPFIRKLRRHGSIPASSAQDFKTQSSRILSTALDGGISQVFVCTIPCLGENLSSQLNKQREEYNQILRDLCLEYTNNLFNCICLDVSAVIEPLLSKSSSNWLFSTAEDFQTDAQKILDRGEELLCKERGLLLTIDGAHLNIRGAEILSSLILRRFKEHSVLF